MVGSCCAFFCKERFVKGGPVTFHSFPKDPLKRRRWLLNLRRKDFNPSPASKVCSKHFKPECFNTKKFGGTWLKPDAVPTIFNFPDLLSSKQSARKSLPKNKSQRVKEQFSLEASSSSTTNFKPHAFTSVSVDSVCLSSSGKSKPLNFNENVLDLGNYSDSSMSDTGENDRGTKNVPRKRFRYIGDFSEKDLEVPSLAEKAFSIANKQIIHQAKRITHLSSLLENLKKQVPALKSHGGESSATTSENITEIFPSQRISVRKLDSKDDFSSAATVKPLYGKKEKTIFSYNPDIEEIRESQSKFFKERNWEEHCQPQNILLAMINEADELSDIFQWQENVQEGLLDWSENDKERLALHLSGILLQIVCMSEKCNLNLPTSVLKRLLKPDVI